MTTFDRIRYAIALLLLLTGPGSVLFWFPIHPLAPFWRRVGARWGYAAGACAFAASAATLATWRHTLLSVDFGTSVVSIGIGVVLLAAHLWLRRQWRRQLVIKTLLGGPELSGGRYPGRLLTEGIYARVRHPRYLEILLGFAGFSCVSNNLGAYGTCAFLLIAILVLVRLEEHELVARFGDAYEEYRRKVPALIPRFKRTAQGGITPF